MKLYSVLAAIAATSSALSIPESGQHVISNGVDVDRFLIEISPDETAWVTEDEKWKLRRVCRRQDYG